MNYSLFLNVNKIRLASHLLLVSGLSISLIAPGLATAEPEAKKVDVDVEQALQLSPDIEKGKRLYYTCAVCHTPEGWGSPSGRYPQIAGQHQSVVLKQLADIHKDNRDNPTMIPFTRPLFAKGTQALADLSAYIEQLPMVPNNSVGSGRKHEQGKKLYEEHCKKCHGDNGEGDARQFYPRIHGQHFNYLLRQMQWIKRGKRRNADKSMVEQLESFSQSDIVTIIDYVSRLEPDKELVADHMDWRNPDFRSNFTTVPRDKREKWSFRTEER